MQRFFAAAIGLVAAACGTSDDSASVPSNRSRSSVTQAITKAEFDDLVNYAKRSYNAQKRPFPKVGTQEYAQIRDQAIEFLVQRAQFDVKADDLGVDVERLSRSTSASTSTSRSAIGGDKAKFAQELKSQGLTRARRATIIRANLVQEAIFNKVTSGVKVNDEDVKTYYDQNKAQYAQPDSARRAPHPRQEQGAGRPALRAAEERRGASRRSRRSTRRTRARRTRAAS